jgi:molybdopterin synthase sulfur carrier subunit
VSLKLSDDSRFRLFEISICYRSITVMAIEVRVPTILRSYTGGAKVVEGSGSTLSELLDDLDAKHSGLKGRLITPEGGLHRFVNIYVNDEDVRFQGSLDAKVSDGDSVTILPAVAGGALGFAAAAALLGR